jgi:hypothetical protein
MSHENLERWVARFRLRTQIGEFLRSAAEGMAIFLCVFGGLVLLVKLALPAFWPNVLWTLCTAVPLSAAIWWFAGSRGWSRRESIAELDRRIGAGGLLMTLLERPDEEWAGRLPQDPLVWSRAIPRVWPKRFAAVVAGPLLFAAAACFVPLRQANSSLIAPHAVAQQATQELEELLKEVEERPVLEEEEKDELKEELQELIEETQLKPLTHEKWEVVDALRERLRVRVDQAEALSLLASEALEALAAGENAEGKPLSPEEREQLEQQLSETLEKLGEKLPASAAKAGEGKAASDLLKRLTQGGKGKPKLSSNPAERQAQIDELKEMLKKECEKLGQCKKKCAGQCKGGECEGECEGGNCTKAGNRPGKGGVTRGRADAELTWGEESDLAGVKFKETVLPPGIQDSPKDEVLQGAASGSAAWNRKLSPRHREVVRKYFDAK